MSPALRDRPVSPTTDQPAASTGTGAVDGLVWMDALLAPLEAGDEESVSIEDEDETEGGIDMDPGPRGGQAVA